MRLVPLALTAVGFLALLAMTVPASAQQQRSDVQMQAIVAEAPDELPGVYEAHLHVVTSNQGGMCVCWHTTVELEAADLGLARQAVLSPSSWTIDWSQQMAEGHYPAEHHQDVRATIAVPQVSQSAGIVKVTIDGQARTDNPGVDADVHPIDLALPVPDGANASQVGQQDASSDDESDDEDPTDGVRTAGQELGAGLDRTALGTGAGVAAVALAGLAARRFEDRP